MTFKKFKPFKPFKTLAGLFDGLNYLNADGYRRPIICNFWAFCS